MHRGDVDHPAIAAIGHRGQREAHGVKAGRQVDCDHRVPGFRVGLGQRHRFLDPGVVHQNVERRPGRHRLHHRLDGARVAQVAVEELCVRRPRRLDCGDRRRRLIGRGEAVDRDLRPGPGQRPGDGQPDAGGRAGDEGHAARKHVGHLMRSLQGMNARSLLPSQSQRHPRSRRNGNASVKPSRVGSPRRHGFSPISMPSCPAAGCAT